MSGQMSFKSQNERAFMALLDFLNMATEELNRPKSKPSLINNRPQVALAVSAIHSLLGDDDSARKYAETHLSLLKESCGGTDLDASFDSIYRLYGDSHGLSLGDTVREGAARWREVLADGNTVKGDPLMFGLRVLIVKVCPKFFGNPDENRLMMGILVLLRLCTRLLEPHERSYQDTVEFASKCLDEVANSKRCNREELMRYIWWHASQSRADFVETVATIMEEMPSLFDPNYPVPGRLLLNMPESELLRARLERAAGIASI